MLQCPPVHHLILFYHSVFIMRVCIVVLLCLAVLAVNVQGKNNNQIIGTIYKY